MKASIPIAIAAFLSAVAPAAASSELLDAPVSVPRAVDASCTGALRPAGDGVARRELTAPAAGYLTARLRGASGEWDLAVFKKTGGPPVAGSTYRGAHEVAAGYVARDDDLVVQACRRSGSGGAARLSVDLDEVDERPVELTLARVATPTADRKADLDRLGVELTEHGGPGYVDVLLDGAGDRAELRDAGFTYKSVAPAAAAAPDPDAALPSGRTTYRRLFEITSELASYANNNPDIVKHFTLPQLTGEGRPIEGLEIATNPHDRDGKPVFVLVGMHHAREWPAADIQMEWARQLIADYRAGSPRARELLGKVRTIIVPVTNADGYNDSREAGQAAGHGAGDSNFNGASVEYRRKNCRLADGTHNCGASPSTGVDPNRNYSAFFGGPGSSTTFASENYRGTGPFSEPETHAIRSLMSSRQVVSMITTHTSGRTILRQPGVDAEPPTPDETQYKALGDSLDAANGYQSQYSKDLYDHGGTTDAWHYYVTGGLGFVFEMNDNYFHPPYSEVIAEYDGTISGANGGNREALYRMTEFTANPAGHAVLRGSAPSGAVLRVARDMLSETQEGPDVPEHLESTMVVPANGQFEWHVNQSSSPFAVKAGRTESWTLTCESPEGAVESTQPVTIARGQSLQVDVGPCGKPGPAVPAPPVEEPATPPPFTDVLEQPGLRAKMSATFDGRVYRVRVKGTLTDTTDLDAPGGASRRRSLCRQGHRHADREAAQGRVGQGRRRRRLRLRTRVQGQGKQAAARAAVAARPQLAQGRGGLRRGPVPAGRDRRRERPRQEAQALRRDGCSRRAGRRGDCRAPRPRATAP